MHETDIDIAYMRLALEEATTAAGLEEIPVGVIVIRDGEIIARAHNLTRTRSNPLAHAEMLAIEAAVQVLGNERLTGCDLYVTKEPCAMCAGAIVHARIRRVVIAAEDSKYGACGTVLSVCGNPSLNHVPEIAFGVLRDEARSMLQEFFARLRRKE